MRCCEAWKPVEDCFDTSSFECIDFQRLSQIVASHTRENLEAREAEVANIPWTQREQDTALASCGSGQRAWRNKKPVLSLSDVTDEEGHSLENEDESERRLCEYWGTIFQAREEGPRHHQHEDILRYVQQAPDDISWTADQAELDDLLALKIDSAPGPDGIPCGAYRCAGGLGSQFLFNAYRALLEGGAVPDHFAESRTVFFIPKTPDIDDSVRIIRSPDALRPLTLCNCNCKLLTSAVCRGLHWYTMRCIHTSQWRAVNQIHSSLFSLPLFSLYFLSLSLPFSSLFFAGPISLRASKVLGPISRYRVADILPHMKLVSRASRLWLIRWFPAHPLQRAMYGTKL